MKPGTIVQMVVDETTYLNYVNSGRTEMRFGGWATFDNVTSQAYARNQLAITNEFKKDVSYVIEVEITKPVQAQVGVVGKQTGSVGGGNQLNFVIAEVRAESVVSSRMTRELKDKASDAFKDNSKLNLLSELEREQAANAYEKIAELTGGKYAELAKQYNLERTKFLRGEISEIAGTAADFAKEKGIKYP